MRRAISYCSGVSARAMAAATSRYSSLFIVASWFAGDLRSNITLTAPLEPEEERGPVLQHRPPFLPSYRRRPDTFGGVENAAMIAPHVGITVGSAFANCGADPMRRPVASQAHKTSSRLR